MVLRTRNESPSQRKRYDDIANGRHKNGERPPSNITNSEDRMISSEGKQGNSKENKTDWYQYVTAWGAVIAGIGAAVAAAVNAYQAYLIRQNTIVSQSAFV